MGHLYVPTSRRTAALVIHALNSTCAPLSCNQAGHAAVPTVRRPATPVGRALTDERAAAKGLLPLAQEPAVPTEAPAEPAEEPQEEPDYDPPSETESEDLTVVAPAEVKAAPKPPSPPAGEIIKGIPPAAAKGRKRSAEQVAPAAPAKKVKESPVPAPATPAAEPSPAPPSATEETRFAMPPIPASFTAATEDQQWDRLATVRGKSAQAPTLLLSTSAGGKLYGWEASLPVLQHHTSHRSPCRWRASQSTPESRGGIVLPNALLRHGRSRTPSGQEPSGGSCGRSSGSHCGVGRACCCTASQGAAGGGTLCRAVMLSEPWEESARWLKTQRDTDLPGLMRDQKVARFLREASTSTALGSPWPQPTWRPSGAPCACRGSRACLSVSTSRGPIVRSGSLIL